MNTLKKMIVLGLVLCMALSFAACGQGEETVENPTQAQTEESTAAPVPTEEPEQTVDSSLVAYTVYVVDEENNPVAGGMLQFCLDTCSPVIIDENGTAKFNGEAVDYEVKFLNLPAGYTYATEEEVFHFAAGETEMTIVLKPEA